MSSSRPQLLDSTLREGEQTAGVAFSQEAKLEIARALDAFGVDYIEVGHPAVSPHVEATVRQVAALGLEAATVAHARAHAGDVDLARATDVEWVGIFHAVRDEALRDRFALSLPQALERIRTAIEHAKAHGLKVRFTPEDTVRTSEGNLRAAVVAAREAGADRISIADTTGSATPARIAELVRFVGHHARLDVHVHCHNDLGLACANALAGLEAGARVVDVSVNGLGERTGIVDLATMATLVARTSREKLPWDLTQLPRLCQRVARESGIAVHPLAPVMGANAFSHKAGLHVAAITRDPSHFEAFPPEMVGRTRMVSVDRYAGLATLEHKCRELGVHAPTAILQRALARIKSEESPPLGDEQFLQLLEQCGPQAAPARPLTV